MHCKKAQALWHGRPPGGEEGSELIRHLADCPKCRQYVRDMRRLVEAFGVLRNETEAVVSLRAGAVSPAASAPPSPSFGWWHRRLLRAAAILALLVGAGVLFVAPFDRLNRDTQRVSEANSRPSERMADENGGDRSRIGLTLRREMAERTLAISLPSSQANVQMYRLYPIPGAPRPNDS